MIQVSVVIPVYNIEAHLEQCLDSVAGQTLTDIEVICVDDGSLDDSPTILARYAAHDDRFQVFRQDNAGPGVARNTGLAQVTGQYVIFLDSDDWFEPDFLEQMVRQLQKTDADMAICRAVEFDTNTGLELPSKWMLKEQYLPHECFPPEDIAEHLYQFTYGWPWDKLYRTDFVRDANLSYPALPNSEDLVFVFQSLALAKRIAILDEILVHHRVNRMSSVSNSRRLEPETPYYAMLMLRDALRQNNLYMSFEKSFVTWAIEFLIWHVASIEERTLQRAYFQKLKQKWLPETGCRSEVHFTSRIVCVKYLLVKYIPYPLLAEILARSRSCKSLWKRQRTA